MQQKILRESLVKDTLLRLGEAPIVTLLGARQVGKTTLARQIMQEFRKATLFDLETAGGRAALETTPELTLRGCDGLVIVDEVQRMPSLFQALRPIADDPARKASFLLLGSASPSLVKGVSESLAGRSHFMTVPGFSISEVGGSAQDRLWIRGSFPRAFLAGSDAAAFRWLESFKQAVLERDVPSLGLRVPRAALERFWNMLGHYHGQVWNAAELGRALGTSASTANHYRDIFAGTYMIRALQPWHENLSKRQVKSPKVYFRDPGLLHQVLGIGDMLSLRSSPRYGASWEGFALEQILSIHGEEGAWFWSTQRGAELDLLLFRKGKRWGFEFKCNDAPTATKSMHIAIDDLGLERLWIVYPGQTAYPLGDRLATLPLRSLDTIDFC